MCGVRVLVVMCVCLCVQVRERERERERTAPSRAGGQRLLDSFIFLSVESDGRWRLQRVRRKRESEEKREKKSQRFKKKVKSNKIDEEGGHEAKAGEKRASERAREKDKKKRRRVSHHRLCAAALKDRVQFPAQRLPRDGRDDQLKVALVFLEVARARVPPALDEGENFASDVVQSLIALPQRRRLRPVAVFWGVRVREPRADRDNVDMGTKQKKIQKTRHTRKPSDSARAERERRGEGERMCVHGSERERKREREREERAPEQELPH